jgi:predicted exporter
VICLYPLIKKPSPAAGFGLLGLAPKLPLFRKIPAGTGRFLLFIIMGISLVLLFVHRDRVRIENDIAGLYTMSGFLAESEKTAARVLNHGSAGWYFIIRGNDPQETLEHEELLRIRLEDEISRGNLGSYLAASVFIPSVRTQKKNYAAAEKLLPLAARQFSYLGFPPEQAELFVLDFTLSRDKYLLPGDRLPGYLEEILDNLWIGEIGGQYYSCVLPLHAGGEAGFRAIAEDLDFVFFINKVKDIGRDLDYLTRIMLLLFLTAYVIVAVVVRVFYSWAQTIRICAIPFLLVMVTAAVLACLGISLGFFSAAGLILTFGLGLDYMFYLAGSGKDSGQGLTILAIVLSFATTALSFGALALSGFMPVHIFGLTVVTGLSTAFISAMLMRGRVS